MADTQLDLLESLRLKREGMETAAQAKPDLLSIARFFAEQLGHQQRFVTADDVRQKMREYGVSTELGPAAGSIFKTKSWRFTGRRVRSRYIVNHARELKVWEYVD